MRNQTRPAPMQQGDPSWTTRGTKYLCVVCVCVCVCVSECVVCVSECVVCCVLCVVCVRACVCACVCGVCVLYVMCACVRPQHSSNAVNASSRARTDTSVLGNGADRGIHGSYTTALGLATTSIAALKSSTSHDSATVDSVDAPMPGRPTRPTPKPSAAPPPLPLPLPLVPLPPLLPV